MLARIISSATVGAVVATGDPFRQCGLKDTRCFLTQTVDGEELNDRLKAICEAGNVDRIWFQAAQDWDAISEAMAICSNAAPSLTQLNLGDSDGNNPFLDEIPNFLLKNDWDHLTYLELSHTNLRSIDGAKQTQITAPNLEDFHIYNNGNLESLPYDFLSVNRFPKLERMVLGEAGDDWYAVFLERTIFSSSQDSSQTEIEAVVSTDDPLRLCKFGRESCILSQPVDDSEALNDHLKYLCENDPHLNSIYFQALQDWDAISEALESCRSNPQLFRLGLTGLTDYVLPLAAVPDFLLDSDWKNLEILILSRSELSSMDGADGRKIQASNLQTLQITSNAQLESLPADILSAKRFPNLKSITLGAESELYLVELIQRIIFPSQIQTENRIM